MAAPKVPVKSGDTLSSIAKANDTTVAAILADPRNAVIAERAAAGKPTIFSGSKVAIPEAAPVNPYSGGYQTGSTSTPTSTYNQRIEDAIKGGYQSELDINANRVTTKKEPDKTTWTKAGTVQTVNGPVDVDANGRAQDGSLPIAVSNEPEVDKPFKFTDPDTGVVTSFATAAELNAFAISWSTTKVSNNKADIASANKALEDKNRRTAQQEFRAALSELGLGDLADAVDAMITEDKTVSQIKLELPKTQAYINRFPGMAALKSAGQAISEATYIANERAMIQAANAYGIDKALVSRDLLGQYIGGQIAPTEFERRAEMAANRVDKRADVVTAMTTFFPGVDKGGMITYLLNPTIGMDVIKKQVRTAEIGAAASAGGFTIGAKGAITGARAESLIDATGTKDLAQLKAEFGQAGILGRTQARLAGIEGQGYDTFEAAQAVVASDAASIMASKKRAEREAIFRFSGGSGVSATSLRSTEVF
jgi:hypothetical protein